MQIVLRDSANVAERVEFGLAWALLIVFASIVLIGAIWMLLNVFVGVLETESQQDLPDYSADQTQYTLGWLTSIWSFVPVAALVSILAWGVLRAVSESRVGGRV